MGHYCSRAKAKQEEDANGKMVRAIRGEDGKMQYSITVMPDNLYKTFHVIRNYIGMPQEETYKARLQWIYQHESADLPFDVDCWSFFEPLRDDTPENRRNRETIAAWRRSETPFYGMVYDERKELHGHPLLGLRRLVDLSCEAAVFHGEHFDEVESQYAKNQLAKPLIK